MTVTISHDPACGTSRNVLGLIRNSGKEPRVVEFLCTSPTQEELVAAIRDAGLSVRDALPRKGTFCDELGLDDAALSADALLRHAGAPRPDQPACIARHCRGVLISTVAVS